MRRYLLVSGLFFTLLACGQAIRFVLQWPAVIATVSIPTWLSAIGALIFASLAVWAFRVRAGTAGA